jgi:hypothetical protein
MYFKDKGADYASFYQFCLGNSHVQDGIPVSYHKKPSPTDPRNNADTLHILLYEDGLITEEISVHHTSI